MHWRYGIKRMLLVESCVLTLVLYASVYGNMAIFIFHNFWIFYKFDLVWKIKVISSFSKKIEKIFILIFRQMKNLFLKVIWKEKIGIFVKKFKLLLKFNVKLLKKNNNLITDITFFTHYWNKFSNCMNIHQHNFLFKLLLL